MEKSEDRFKVGWKVLTSDIDTEIDIFFLTYFLKNASVALEGKSAGKHCRTGSQGKGFRSTEKQIS